MVTTCSSKVPAERPLLACERREGSQLWIAIQRIKHEIRNGLSLSIGNGEGTLFRLEQSVGGFPLCIELPNVFAICLDPMMLVSMAAHDVHWNILFRRSFRSLETEE